MKMRAGVTGSLLLQICTMLILALFMFACKPNNQTELYGTYIADYDIAKEKLILNKDGTYVQEVTFKATSKIDIAKGSWIYDPKSGYVSFEENFMVVLDGFRKLNSDYAQPKVGAVSQPADKYFGQLLLGAAEGIIYNKTN